MSGSLQNTFNNSQPASTEATIRLASKTKSKDTIVWIVAEGDDDADLYGKMYDKYFVHVLPSADKNGKKSCKNVEVIVSNILADSKIKIIGIRDKDYTGFTGYTPPQNIYLTDRRDIEMQITEVKFCQISPNITPESLNDVFLFARQVGFYRIFNDKESLGFRFGNIVACDYWDFGQKRLKPGWNTNLESFFFNNIPQVQNISVLKSKYSVLESQIKSKKYSDYDLCQGHEVVNLLKRIGSSALSQLEKDLFKWYGRADYTKSNLAKNIASWARMNSYSM